MQMDNVGDFIHSDVPFYLDQKFGALSYYNKDILLSCGFSIGTLGIPRATLFVPRLDPVV